MRGEAVPAGSRWIGNPIAPWSAAAATSQQRRISA